MITGRLLSTSDNGTTWSSAPEWVVHNNVSRRSADMAARGEWNELIASVPPTYREWRESGTAWLGYDDPVIEPNPEPDDNIDVAVVRLTGTFEERAEAQRESIRQSIEQNRVGADVRNIDLSSDAGRQVLMDEANDRAESKLNELAATQDPDLDSFDPNFDPLQIGSITTAASLYVQTERTLATDPTLDAQQIMDLEALKSAYAQVVIDGNDAAPVPKPTDNVRLKLGVVAEGYGTMQVRRIENEGWWWLEFEVRTDRELSVADYWIAVYDENNTYLTTPRLTQVPNNGLNVYRADRLAVHLPHQPPKEYRYALCHQHISNQQFDPVALGANENERIDPIRWGGNAS